MRESHPIEQAVGINYYISDADGIGGHCLLYTTYAADEEDTVNVGCRRMTTKNKK